VFKSTEIIYSRERRMTCYFRHLQAIFEEAGVTVTKKNRKKIDEAIHSIVGVEYKNCPEAWKQVKTMINDHESRELFISKLRDAISSMSI